MLRQKLLWLFWCLLLAGAVAAGVHWQPLFGRAEYPHHMLALLWVVAGCAYNLGRALEKLAEAEKAQRISLGP